jgi:hypothetical protein
VARDCGPGRDERVSGAFAYPPPDLQRLAASHRQLMGLYAAALEASSKPGWRRSLSNRAIVELLVSLHAREAACSESRLHADRRRARRALQARREVLARTRRERVPGARGHLAQDSRAIAEVVVVRRRRRRGLGVCGKSLEELHVGRPVGADRLPRDLRRVSAHPRLGLRPLVVPGQARGHARLALARSGRAFRRPSSAPQPGRRVRGERRRCSGC